MTASTSKPGRDKQIRRGSGDFGSSKTSLQHSPPQSPFGQPGRDAEPAARGVEELLTAYGQLQEQNRRRTEALAGAAHELKTPLAIIAGYIDLLLSQKSGSLNAQQRQILEESQLSCTRLQRFIQDLLTYGALETGKLAMDFDHGDLNLCLREVYGFWAPRFKEKGVAFYFPCDERLKPFEFDYHKMQHIISNLLENSLKFTPAEGTVWMTAEPHVWERRANQDSTVRQERRRSSHPLANSARVTVSDTGPGIAAEYQQEVFDDFFKPPQDRSGGTGLGLAIARRLVHAHSGKIWVESIPGSGSKFCFLLPFRPH